MASARNAPIPGHELQSRSMRENESLLAFAQRIKQFDRTRLSQLHAAEAQAEVDAVLVTFLSGIQGPIEMRWPGDLGDEPEVPDWLSGL